MREDVLNLDKTKGYEVLGKTLCTAKKRQKSEFLELALWGTDTIEKVRGGIRHYIIAFSDPTTRRGLAFAMAKESSEDTALALNASQDGSYPPGRDSFRQRLSLSQRPHEEYHDVAPCYPYQDTRDGCALRTLQKHTSSTLFGPQPRP